MTKFSFQKLALLPLSLCLLFYVLVARYLKQSTTAANKYMLRDAVQQYHRVEYTSTNNTAVLMQQQQQQRPLELLHVISPYRVLDCDDLYCPYDQAQSVTIASMQRARDTSASSSGVVHVTLAASVLPDSLNVVPSDFVTLPLLNRSTATLYETSRQLPFVEDVFSSFRSSQKFDYVIYSNVDIAVRHDFYNQIANIITTQQLQAFAVNRLEISKFTKTGELFTKDDLEELYKTPGKGHPGHDCFILSKDIVEKMKFGKVFLGYPPVGRVILAQAQLLAGTSRHHKVFRSKHGLTFHLGRDGSWKKERHGDSLHGQNMRNVQFGLPHVVKQCLERSSELIGCRLLLKQIRPVLKREGNDGGGGRVNVNVYEEEEQDEDDYKHDDVEIGIDESHTLIRDDKQQQLVFVQDSSSPLLKPPFRIVQIGTPRSGSTFQFQLLSAIAHLKSSRPAHVHPFFVSPRAWNETDFLDTVAQNTSFVLKVHFDRPIFQELNRKGEIAIFSSGKRAHATHYNQEMMRLLNCSLCEIDRYRAIFGLTDEDVELLKQHMSMYEKIRQCCGLQMSKYQMLRLHGCDVNSFVNEPAYPNCEAENMTDLELRFHNSPIPYHSASPEQDWSKPGDCARFDLEITSENKGFNGNIFPGCKSRKYRGVYQKKVVSTEAAMTARILKPPFRIVQIGEIRSGSTFQYQLLQAIAHLKSPSDAEIHTDFVNPRSWDQTKFQKSIAQDTSFVLKLHFKKPIFQELHDKGNIAVFTSGKRASYGHYNQYKDRLLNCSLCEIDQYRTIFDLTDEDVELLKQHMSLYEKLRQCCGLQMSKYQLLRLHGCDVSSFVGEPEFPNCEAENMTDVELRFHNSPIPYQAEDPGLEWAEPGDCARFDLEITTENKGFNGRTFPGCDSPKYQRLYKKHAAVTSQ